MATDWFYESLGDTVGPLDDAELKKHAQDGKLTREMYVRKGDSDKWVPAFNVKGLFHETVWFYECLGGTVGPLNVDQLKKHAQDGKLTREMYVRKGESDKWVPALNVKGLFSGTAKDGGITLPEPEVTQSKISSTTTLSQSQTSEQTGTSVSNSAPPESNLTSEKPPEHLCIRCKGIVHPQARVCPHCNAHQNPGEYLLRFCLLWIFFMVVFFVIFLAAGGERVTKYILFRQF